MGAAPRESTEAMVRHIGLELAEIGLAMARCRGDAAAEPRLTGTWMAHLLICSDALLHNLLIDTAIRPRQIQLPGPGGSGGAGVGGGAEPA
jgi:hypothetical protein